MPRARYFKPGFFKNEQLAELDPLARLLFAGLWTLADRDGRLEDRPKRIRAEILPYDDCSVDQLMQILHTAGFIVRYEVDGEKYVAIPGWSKHQHPHVNETKSVIPKPGELGASSETFGSETGKNGASSPLTLTLTRTLTRTLTHAPRAAGRDAFAEAGWPDNSFGDWWDDLVKTHPNRKANKLARDAVMDLIQKGGLNRAEWEFGYGLWRADWRRENDRFAKNLLDFVQDGLWKLPPTKPPTDAKLPSAGADWVREN